MTLKGLNKFEKIYPLFIRKFEDFNPLPENKSITDKVNSMILYLNSVGKLTNDVVNDWNKVMQWVMDDGLKEAIYNKVDQLIIENKLNELIEPIVREITDLAEEQISLIENNQVATKNELQVVSEQLANTNKKISGIVNVMEFGALGNGSSDDTIPLQNAINYAELNNLELVFPSKKVFIITDTLYYSTAKINGNNSTLKNTTTNKPILKNRILLDKTGGVTSRGLIQNLKFEGNLSNPNNHGMNIIAFWSVYRNLEFVNIGGHAIKMQHQHDDGTVLATGTLVENQFLNIIVRGCTNIPLYLGGAGNNKTTDGIVSNAIIATSAERAIFLGSGAGWIVENIHIYGKPTIPLQVENGFNTIVNNVYIEDFKEYAISMGAIQRNVVISNVNIDATSSNNNSSCIRLDRMLSSATGNVSVILNNINVHHEDTSKISYIFNMANTVTVSASNIVKSGLNRDGISLTNGDRTLYKLIEDASVIGRIRDIGKYYMTYESRQLKQCLFNKFSGSSDINSVFVIPALYEFSKLVGKITIDSSQFHNGGKCATWEGRLYVSWKSTADNPTVYITPLVAPSGFSVNPTVTIDKTSSTITVNFTQSDGNGNGVVTFDFIVCPN